MRTPAYILLLSAEIALAAWMFSSGLNVIGFIFAIFAFFMLSGMIAHIAAKALKNSLKTQKEQEDAENIAKRLKYLGYKDVKIVDNNGKTEIHYKEPKPDLRQFLN